MRASPKCAEHKRRSEKLHQAWELTLAATIAIAAEPAYTARRGYAVDRRPAQASARKAATTASCPNSTPTLKQCHGEDPYVLSTLSGCKLEEVKALLGNPVDVRSCETGLA